MSSYSDLSQKLQTSLNLTIPPISICLTGSVPEGIPMYDGVVPAGCSFWEKAVHGPFATATPDHELCSIGVYTHNMAEPSSNYKPELETVLNVLNNLEYVRPEDLSSIAKLEHEVNYVLYSPLESTPLKPDVVLLFAQSQQSLIITESVQQVDPSTPPALGRPACSIVPQAINSKQAALSLGCCGARAYLKSLSDEVALWALPGERLEQYVSRISILAKANDTLSQFHQIRHKNIEAGGRPSYQESFNQLENLSKS